MRPMSDYAPPHAPMNSGIPIDLPDEMEIREYESRAILWLALVLCAVLAIAAAAVIVVMA